MCYINLCYVDKSAICLHNWSAMLAEITSCHFQRALIWKRSMQSWQRVAYLINSARWPDRLIRLPLAWRLSAGTWVRSRRMHRSWRWSSKHWCIRQDECASRPMTIRRVDGWRGINYLTLLHPSPSKRNVRLSPHYAFQHHRSCSVRERDTFCLNGRPAWRSM